MHNEHVLQVLHGALHPVVERGGPLGELHEQLINGLQQLIGALRGLQDVPGLIFTYRNPQNVQPIA